MSPENIRGIGPTEGPNPDPKAPPTAPESTEFRRLLDRLEALQATSGDGGDDGGEGDPARFAEDLKKADDSFLSVMDLRRRLEEAFRRGQE